MEERFMESGRKSPKYLRVKDKTGNEFLCPLEALKNVKDATEEELNDCVEGDVVGRYAGDIEVGE
jgi:hypothetical protein